MPTGRHGRAACGCRYRHSKSVWVVCDKYRIGPLVPGIIRRVDVDQVRPIVLTNAGFITSLEVNVPYARNQSIGCSRSAENHY